MITDGLLRIAREAVRAEDIFPKDHLSKDIQNLAEPRLVQILAIQHRDRTDMQSLGLTMDMGQFPQLERILGLHRGVRQCQMKLQCLWVVNHQCHQWMARLQVRLTMDLSDEELQGHLQQVETACPLNEHIQTNRRLPWIRIQMVHPILLEIKVTDIDPTRASVISTIHTTKILAKDDPALQPQKCQTSMQLLLRLEIIGEELLLMVIFSHLSNMLTIRSSRCSHNLMFGTELSLKQLCLKWLVMRLRCQMNGLSKALLMTATGTDTIKGREDRLSKGMEDSTTQFSRMGLFLHLEVSQQLRVLVVVAPLGVLLWAGFPAVRNLVSMVCLRDHLPMEGCLGQIPCLLNRHRMAYLLTHRLFVLG